MNKVILYIATSLDGYIADVNGGVDWLPHPTGNDDEFGYMSLMDRIKIIIMGSRSYEQILSFGEWGWPDKQSYVFTSRSLSTSISNIKFVSGDVKFFTDMLQNEQINCDIWLLGGAELIKSFAAAKLIDECIITVIPKILSAGISLELPYEDFNLHKTNECSNSVVQKFYLRQ